MLKVEAIQLRARGTISDTFVSVIACLFLSQRAARSQERMSEPSAQPSAPPASAITAPNAGGPTAEPNPTAPVATTVAATLSATPTLEPVAVARQPQPRAPAPSADDGRERTSAFYSNFRFGLSPGIFLSRNGGSPGLSVGGYMGYGFDTGSLIVVPGASAALMFASSRNIYSLVPEVRLVMPIGFVAPFVDAGAGPLFDRSPEGDKVVLGVRLGGGFSLHPSRSFALGLSASYLLVPARPQVAGLTIAPIIAFSL
jgi:hypothetical protein